MKRTLLLILAVLWSILLQSQNIAKMEYWIDTDPGFGQATPITGFANQPLINQFGFNTMSLSVGAHTLGFRSKDANGKWSHTNFIQLYISEPVVDSDIVSVEYFWDVDPGFGNGQSFDFTAAEVITQEFPVVIPAGLSIGNHWLFFRTLDSENRYSHTNYIQINFLGLDKMESDSFKMYPNPVEDHLNIDLKQKGKTRFLMYDLTGKVVTDAVVDQSAQIRVGHLASGVYSVYLWTEDHTIYTTKIIKK